MKILIIEDQVEWIEDVAKAASGAVEVFAPIEVGLLAEPTEGEAIEDQLADTLAKVVAEHAIDLVLLDSDLSRAQGKLQSQSSYRVALQELGIPVCRYQKGKSESVLVAWQRLQRIAADGASAVWIARERVSGDRFSELVPWLTQLYGGFHQIDEQLKSHPEWLRDLSPAEVLSQVVGRSSLKTDLLGYTGQNLFFFAPPSSGESSGETNRRRFSTRLGYWLYNYVMTFPGPILSMRAAAAFTNLKPEAFELPEVQALVAKARYRGPFGGTEQYWWREDLSMLLDELDGDIAADQTLSGMRLARVDSDAGAQSYLCMLSNDPTARSELAPNPDWIPPGAYQAGIKESLLDKLGPLLGI